MFLEKVNNEILKQKVESYSNQIEIMLQSDEKIRILHHDLKHHINELNILATKKDTKAIQEYIGRMNITLDNAIEAAGQTNEKEISVLIRLQQGILKINIKNSYSGELIYGENKRTWEKVLLSTKKNDKQHGIGLSSVKKIVDDYNGIMTIDQNDNFFDIKIILYMQKTDIE